MINTTPFEPTKPGHYVVTLEGGINHAEPYHDRIAYEKERIVCTVLDGDLGVCYINGNMFTPTKCSAIKARYWHGPMKHVRRCFKCERYLVSAAGWEDDQDAVLNKYVLYPDDGPSFESTGHYGCSTLDDLGHRTFHIVVCDACIIAHADKVLVWETQTFTSIKTHKLLRKNDFNHHMLSDYHSAVDAWHKAEAEFFAKNGMEWRYYNDKNERTTPDKADPNHCGWFKKTAKKPKAKLSARHNWEKDKKLLAAWTALRNQMLGAHANSHSPIMQMMVDEDTGEEMTNMEHMRRSGVFKDLLKNLKSQKRKRDLKKAKKK